MATNCTNVVQTHIDVRDSVNMMALCKFNLITLKKITSVGGSFLQTLNIS